MDREEESICCQEIPACVSINQEAAQIEEIPVPECITDNPAFQYLCLNYWVLQVAWSDYRQHYGIKAHEGPEDILGKEIRVPLPSCAVSCILAHFPPPGLEEDFVFEGFKFADE
jgi:hypothetical protein